jgi:histidinol-phosphate aminotransferase
MIDLNSIVRQNILTLKPYSSARDEYQGDKGIFLDANENPYGEENRYPDPYQRVLKEKIGKLKKIDPNKIFIGNGSDEIIDLAFRIFCNPGIDKALTFSPTYGMYDVSANINDVELIKVPLNSDFQINLAKTLPYLEDPNLKLIFVCSPNNPTGNLICTEVVESLLNKFNGLIIIDEAYIDFSKSESWLTRLTEYPNLLIMQTFSKAWGLANSRVGMAFMSDSILNFFNKVKPPYNVSGANQTRVIKALSNSILFQSNLFNINTEKLKLIKRLKEIKLVEEIYPSETNFLLVKVKSPDDVYLRLIKRGIIIRNRDKIVKGCLRITVGNSYENKQLIKILKEIEL